MGIPRRRSIITAADYNAYVEGYLYDDGSGLLVDYGSEEGYSIAEVFTTASANVDDDYTLNSYHDVIATYYYQEIQKSPEGCYPCDGCNSDCYYYYENWYWYDPFGFSFASTGSYGSWWYLYGFGPPTEVEYQDTQYLGATYAQKATPKPKSLSVVPPIPILPTGTTGDHGCTPSGDYGIEVAVRYQVVGDDDQPLRKANMRPEERLKDSVLNGTSYGDPVPDWTPVGPSRISGTSDVTDSNGQFLDAPWGFCWPSSFTHTEKQEISIVVGSKRYSVRTNNITESSSASGAGSTSNGSDIQKSRP